MFQWLLTNTSFVCEEEIFWQIGACALTLEQLKYLLKPCY